MTLVNSGREYIARNIGLSDCWVYSGLSWTAVSVLGDRVSRTGGTGKAVNDIILPATDHIEIGALSISKATLRTNNGGNDVTISDVVNEILLNDGYPAGETKYCVGAPPPTPTPTPPPTPTPLPTPPPGTGLLYLATDPGLAKATIDQGTAIEKIIETTKDATKGEYDTIELTAPAHHTVRITKSGYDDFYVEFDLGEGERYAIIESLKAVAGADVALLTVNVYNDEARPLKEPIAHAAVKKGTKFMGFAPYSDYWAAAPGGTNYNLSVYAVDRETYESVITLYKDTPRTIDVYLKEKKIARRIIIAPGVAYIGDLSLKDGSILFIGSKVDGWVRVETFIDEPVMFKAMLTFCLPNTQTPAWSPLTDAETGRQYHIITESKLLHSTMTATERHLDWAPWLVPDRPGEYSLVAELVYVT